MAEVFRWHDAFWDHGEFGEKQLAGLQDMLGRDEVKACGFRVIYFHHHPFPQFPLSAPKDSGELRAVILKAIAGGVSVDALFYGHNHWGGSDNGRWGIPRCYNAGTATNKRRPLIIDWVPWGRTKSATRRIHLDKPAMGNDRELFFL